MNCLRDENPFRPYTFWCNRWRFGNSSRWNRFGTPNLYCVSANPRIRKMDFKDLMDAYETFQEIFHTSVSISILTERWNPLTKMLKWNVFGRKTNMVATTVIEVGVNVPNAVSWLLKVGTFCLSQLHHCGRVGRGEQSYCILMTSHNWVLIVKPEWKLWFKRMMVLK
jgi:RecG-like helicase